MDRRVNFSWIASLEQNEYRQFMHVPDQLQRINCQVSANRVQKNYIENYKIQISI